MGNGNRDKKAKALVSCVASAALAFSLFAMPAMAFAETNENSTSSGRIIRQMESLERSDSDLDSTLTDDAGADEGYPEDSLDSGVADDAAIEGEDGSDNSQEEAQTQEDDPSIFDSIFQFFSSLSPFSVTSEDMHDASMRVELLSRVSSAAQASGGDLTLTLRGTTGGGTYSARFNAQTTTYENFITDTHSAAGNARVQSQTPVKYIAEIHEIPAGSYNVEVTGTNYGKYTHGGTVTLVDGDLADFYLIDSLYPPDGTSVVSLDNRTGLVPYGDFTGDGVIDDADSEKIAEAVHEGSTNPIYDFTGDGAVDLADVQHFAENVNKSHAATEVRISKDVSQMDSSFNEGTSAGVKPGGTGSAGTDQDKAADSLFYDDGDTIELKHTSGIDISEENPVGFTIDSKGVGIGAFAVQFPLDENNKPYFMGDGGRIDLELDDPIAGDNESDKVYKLFADIKEATGNIEDLKPSNDPDEHPYDFMYQRLRAYLFKETGQLVIVFSDEITPVKLRSAKITFTSTTNPTNKTIEISHVEFLNSAADLNLPVFPDAPEVTDVQTGDEMISLAWEGDENALAYDVEVGINNQTDVYTTSARSLTIDSHSTSGSLENDALYSVRVRSIGLKGNSVWSSPVSAVPEDRTAPEGISAPSLSAGYSQITASWDSVDNANSYILYFKKATDENFSSAELEGNSYTVKNLESYTEYEFYLVAENDYGTSEPSEVVRTSTTSAGGKIPWFNLINRASQNSDLYPHVNSFDSVEIDGLDAGAASAVVDGNFDTYVELGRASEQTGGTNATVSATLKEPSDLRSLAFTTYMGEGFSDDVENVYVRVIGEGAGAEGAEGESAGVEGELFTLDSGLSLHSVPSEGGAEGAAVNTVYVELPRTIEGAKTVRVSFTRAGGLPATIAELGLYRSSGLEEEVAGVWADETHVSLRKGMDAAAFDELEKRIESRDENSAENGHEAEMHPLVSEFRSALSDARQMLDFENPVYMNVNTSISASESSVGGMNAWQPLGLVAKAGEKIKVYVSTPSGNTGEPTKLRLIASQYMGGKDSQFAPVGYLLTGMNELTVPEIGQLPEGSNVERGGALYLEYTGEVGAESYGVNVLGGTRIPVLDLTGLSGTSKQRSERVMQYTMQLEEYVNTLSKVHGDAGHTGTGFLGMFVDSDCFANMTEIVTDHAILTLPATKLVLELSSTDMTEVADRIDAIAQTTDSMFKLAYQHKGLFSVSDNPNLARAYGYDNEIATARHNVRCMDLADGQSACSATNFIGITSDGVSELLKIENIELSSDGSYESGEYLGALVAHALGHQLSDNASAIDEVSANYFTQLLTSHDDNNSVVFNWDDVFNRVTSGALGQLDARLGAAALWQLHLAYDEGFAHAVYDDPDDQMANLIFARINAYARNPECAPYSLSLDDTDASNKFVRLACAAAKRDLSGFFKAWGVELDPATRAYASNFALEQRQIQYLTDESAKAAHAGVGAGMDLVDASASVSFDKDAQTVTVSNIKAGGASAKNARGFEILRKNDDGDFIPVGFVSAGETTFVESAVSLPENEVQYKVRAIDNAGNASVASDELSVRVERASVAGGVSNFTMPTDKSKWAVTSNMVSVEGESDTANSAGIFGAFACASAPQADLGCAVDGDVKTAFTGNVPDEAMKHQVTIALNDVMDVSGIRYYPLDKESSFRGVDIEVSLNGKDWTLVNTSMLYFPASDNYKGYDAFGRSDNAVIYFTDADAADDASASDMLATYSASFIRLTEWAENANPVSIAEIDVLSTPIYSVSLASEAEHFGMGKLTEDVTLQSSHVEGDDAEAYRQNALSEANSVSIPKGSLIIMGDYTGNPVYNTVVIKDGDGNIIANPSKQIIITNKAGQNDVAIVERAAMVREGVWLYYFEPGTYEDMLEEWGEIHPELYRTEGASSIEGAKLVSVGAGASMQRQGINDEISVDLFGITLSFSDYEVHR